VTEDERAALRDAEIGRIDEKRKQLEAKCAEGDARSIEVWVKLTQRVWTLCGFVEPIDVALHRAAEELKRLLEGSDPKGAQ
jgi:hypothetical protein